MKPFFVKNIAGWHVVPGPTTSAGHAGWLRMLLVCMLFSALHGVLGAWVVPAVADGDVAEICTPTGMQWVRVADGQAAPDGNPSQPWPQGLAKPCVWAAALASAPPPLHVAVFMRLPVAAVPTGPGPQAIWSDTVARVLLMSAMRAPPLG